MTPGLRNLSLTAHITFSVGWLGSVAGFLVLSIAGVTSHDPSTVRGAYLSMNLLGQLIIVPLSFAALLTGLISSLGTDWGLFRRYWVLVKFVLTIGATLLLLLHQFTAVAGAARRISIAAGSTLPQIGRLGTQLVGDAALAVLVLLACTVLSVYKPWGLTRYGRRLQQDSREALGAGRLPIPRALGDPASTTAADALPLGLRIFLAVIGVTLAVGFALHHIGGALGSHGH